MNNFKTNPKEVVYLEVNVLNKLDINDVTWQYSIGAGPENDVNDLKVPGVDDRILIVKENKLIPGSIYTFFVSAKSNDGVVVESNIKMTVNSEPILGDCSIQPVAGDSLSVVPHYDIACVGFRDKNKMGPLNYEFYQMSSKHVGQGTLLGYSITGKLENVILTDETIRVKVSDTYGTYVDYVTTVQKLQ
ncbi:uncharacterized protein LOC124361260 [Homalodisca vitripennis]|uniref:uncharacterized protein LOC124361260 n=1 Tax=Homalodisca vitripennis TaxID=197043 RepID=UPI001EEA9A63|nr:uncharacterized protein LOC124361260 [Homalodisca vitripennis]